MLCFRGKHLIQKIIHVTDDPHPWKIQEEHIERCIIKNTITFCECIFQRLYTWQRNIELL